MSCGSTVCSSTSIGLSARRGRAHRSVYVLGKRWIAFAILCLERHRQRKALLGLDGRLLRDIGITRDEAIREAKKPFWK